MVLGVVCFAVSWVLSLSRAELGGEEAQSMLETTAPPAPTPMRHELLLRLPRNQINNLSFIYLLQLSSWFAASQLFYRGERTCSLSCLALLFPKERAHPHTHTEAHTHAHTTAGFQTHTCHLFFRSYFSLDISSLSECSRGFNSVKTLSEHLCSGRIPAHWQKHSNSLPINTHTHTHTYTYKMSHW